jgi:hypothetical protein
MLQEVQMLIIWLQVVVKRYRIPYCSCRTDILKRIRAVSQTFLSELFEQAVHLRNLCVKVKQILVVFESPLGFNSILENGAIP